MVAKDLTNIKEKIERLKREKEHAKHRFLALPEVQKMRKVRFTLPHFSEETKHKFREVASKLHAHMQRVASNRAFAERLREGQTALNRQTGDLITKTKETGKGYIATKKLVKV